MIRLDYFISFPKAWGRRRVDEARVALYSGVLGAVFLVDPAILNRPVYDELGGQDGAWVLGLVLMLAATGHVIALWINGSNARLSRLIRLMACTFHVTIILTFFVVFVRFGAWWATASMGLVLSLLYSAMYRILWPEAQ